MSESQSQFYKVKMEDGMERFIIVQGWNLEEVLERTGEERDVLPPIFGRRAGAPELVSAEDLLHEPFPIFTDAYFE